MINTWRVLLWKNVENMEKRLFFRAATAGLEKYHTGSYGQIGVYRVKNVSLNPIP